MTIKIIEPTGILDDGVSSNKLRKEVNDVIAQGADKILIDCQKVTFINSTGLGSLVAILKMVKRERGSLYLCSLTAQVKIVMELSNMEFVFTIFKDRSEFEAKVTA